MSPHLVDCIYKAINQYQIHCASTLRKSTLITKHMSQDDLGKDLNPLTPGPPKVGLQSSSYDYNR